RRLPPPGPGLGAGSAAWWATVVIHGIGHRAGGRPERPSACDAPAVTSRNTLRLWQTDMLEHRGRTVALSSPPVAPVPGASFRRDPRDVTAPNHVSKSRSGPHPWQ